MLFPTDLASFLDLIRQHGSAAYSLMFAYGAAHSLLLTLFAGYAVHSGALDFGTLIAAGPTAEDLITWLTERARSTSTLPWRRPLQNARSPGRTRPADSGGRALAPAWRAVRPGAGGAAALRPAP